MTATDPSAIAGALLAHFDDHRRSMPWRETRDPYAIWVSEVMLQQTRVDTAVPYWERWIERFPTVDELADASLDEVLKEWEGLGYYSRARNLHSAARMVRERHGGVVPADVAALRELPGVGEYTAGAVASIAFGVPTPAVDGNVRRVLSRIYDMKRPTAGELREKAAPLVPADRPGDFNQALMELGATICTPRSPDCSACPLTEWCQARRAGVQEQRPLPVKGKQIPRERVRTLVLVRDDGALLLVRRPEEGLLGGLWEFPEEGDFRIDMQVGAANAPSRERETGQALDEVVHTFSHKRVVYAPELCRVEVLPARESARVRGEPGERESGGDVGEFVELSGSEAVGGSSAWVAPDRLEEYALPVAQRKIARSALTSLAEAAAT